MATIQEKKADTSRVLHVTQVRSAIGTKPKHRGTLRALGLRVSARATTCRPPRDPGHAGTRAAPDHRRRGDVVKLHDLEPRRAHIVTAAASDAASAARAARPPAVVRRASAPAAQSRQASKVASCPSCSASRSCAASRTRSGSSTPRSTSTPSWRSASTRSPSRPWSTRASPVGRPWSRCSAAET